MIALYYTIDFTVGYSYYVLHVTIKITHVWYIRTLWGLSFSGYKFVYPKVCIKAYSWNIL